MDRRLDFESVDGFNASPSASSGAVVAGAPAAENRWRPWRVSLEGWLEDRPASLGLAWSGAGASWESVEAGEGDGESWWSSGLAILRPPKDCERLRSPSMAPSGRACAMMGRAVVGRAGATQLGGTLGL